MEKTAIRFAAVVIACMIAGTAVAQHAGHGMPAAAAEDAASTREFQAADAAMMKSMDIPYTGKADVDFRQHMIPHHAGAIAMAEVALKYATDESTRQLARTIIQDQRREIAEMQEWLAANAGK